MKLLTLNLRHDEDRWPERSELVLEELVREHPDVIAFQEVALHIDQAHFIADKLNAKSTKRRSEEHTSELQSHLNIVCRLLLEKKNKASFRRAAALQDS